MERNHRYVLRCELPGVRSTAALLQLDYVMTTFIVIMVTFILIFLLGLLVGASVTTRTQEGRDRRQATVQRHLNEQWDALRNLREASTKDTP